MKYIFGLFYFFVAQFLFLTSTAFAITDKQAECVGKAQRIAGYVAKDVNGLNQHFAFYVKGPGSSINEVLWIKWEQAKAKNGDPRYYRVTVSGLVNTSEVYAPHLVYGQASGNACVNNASRNNYIPCLAWALTLMQQNHAEQFNQFYGNCPKN